MINKPISPANMPDTNPDCEHQTILVVYDDNISAMHLAPCLRLVATELLVPTLAASRSISPPEDIDMAILDVLMPGMD